MLKDPRTWKHRREREQQAWCEVMPGLVTSYRQWRYASPTPAATHAEDTGLSPPNTHTIDSTLHQSVDASNTLDGSSPEVRETSSLGHGASPCYDFDIDVLDVYALANELHVPRAMDSASQVEALAEVGYLTTTPEAPRLAISF